ncbi:MAG: UpxY family transcription antiterminator [Bacteroidales bacterium]|nr:UpxY family transcription antiterminator [Bacteroidales bacterium]
MDARQEGEFMVKANSKEPESKWYAVYTRPRFEKQVLKGLLDQGIEAYLPLIKTMREWSDRKKMVEVPLFSSYVFVHIDRRHYDQVLRTHGAVKYITFEGKAASIPSEQINNLKIIVDSNEKVETTWESRRKGDLVMVTAGSLKGLKGELITEGNRKKVLVRIMGIDQNLTVEVHASLIEKIN